jgi:iron complex outermembrane receptor protein
MPSPIGSRHALDGAGDDLSELRARLQGWRLEQPLHAPLTQDLLDALLRFDQEEAETFELGFKLDLLGRTLRLNGAVFTSDYTDMQVTYRGPIFPLPTPPGVAPFLTNAGEASIDGAELELTWVPTDAWLIEGSVGYLETNQDALISNPLLISPGLAVGNVLPYSPEWQLHAGISYTANAGNIEITPRIDASYQTETFFDPTLTQEIAQLDDVTVLNASLTFKPTAGAWRVTVGVNNATDEEYPVAGNSSLTTGSGYAEVAFARPREWFATVSYDFR